MAESFLKAFNGRSGQFAKSRLVGGAFMISFSGVWVKLCHVTPTASAFYRVLFGGIFLLAAALMKRELRWLKWPHALLGLLCGLFFSIDLICYHYSIRYIGPGLGTVLPNFQVFVLAVAGALLLKERIRLIAIFSMPFAFGGLFLIVGVDWNQLDRFYKAGIYFGLGAALFYSIFLLSLRKLQAAQKGQSIFHILMVVSLTSAALIALELFWSHGTFRIPDRQSLWSLVALGLFSQAIGWILIANALPHVRASLSGLILLLQPALAFIWDVLLFARPTSITNWIGLAVVLAAIYLGATGALPTRRR